MKNIKSEFYFVKRYKPIFGSYLFRFRQFFSISILTLGCVSLLKMQGICVKITECKVLISHPFGSQRITTYPEKHNLRFFTAHHRSCVMVMFSLVCVCRHYTSLPSPLLVASAVHHWRPVQTSLFEDAHPQVNI